MAVDVKSSTSRVGSWNGHLFECWSVQWRARVYAWLEQTERELAPARLGSSVQHLVGAPCTRQRRAGLAAAPVAAADKLDYARDKLLRQRAERPVSD